MTEEQHKWLFLTVRDLDAMLPRPEAAVQIASDGEEFFTLTATQEGYLRLGVEMLKAATLTPCEKEADGTLRVDVDLQSLIAPGNEIDIERFVMVDSIPPLPEPEPYVAPPANHWNRRQNSLFVFGFLCLLLILLLAGLGVFIVALNPPLH
jgi:hypothetical protein